VGAGHLDHGVTAAESKQDCYKTGFPPFPLKLEMVQIRRPSKALASSDREEKCHAEITFISVIPEGNVSSYTQEEATFSNTESHSDNKKASKVVDKTHAGYG